MGKIHAITVMSKRARLLHQVTKRGGKIVANSWRIRVHPDLWNASIPRLRRLAKDVRINTNDPTLPQVPMFATQGEKLKAKAHRKHATLLIRASKGFCHQERKSLAEDKIQRKLSIESKVARLRQDFIDRGHGVPNKKQLFAIATTEFNLERRTNSPN